MWLLMLVMMAINANKLLLICSAHTLMDLGIDLQWLLASEKDNPILCTLEDCTTILAMKHYCQNMETESEQNSSSKKWFLGNAVYRGKY